MIGERLRAARRRAGLTQRELAAKAGVSAMSISRYECGRRYPSGRTLLKITRALGIRASTLFEPVRQMNMKCLSHNETSTDNNPNPR